MTAQAFGVTLFPNARYRGRIVVHYPRLISEGALKDKLAKAGFRDIALYESDALPADWPEAERGEVKDKWTAFLEGTHDGVQRPVPPASTSDYTVIGFWYYKGGPHKIVGADGKTVSTGKEGSSTSWEDTSGGVTKPPVAKPAALPSAPKQTDPFVVAGVALAALGGFIVLFGGKKKTREP